MSEIVVGDLVVIRVPLAFQRTYVGKAYEGLIVRVIRFTDFGRMAVLAMPWDKPGEPDTRTLPVRWLSKEGSEACTTWATQSAVSGS